MMVIEMTEEYYTWLALDPTDEEFEKEISSVIERPRNEWIVAQIDKGLRENMAVMKELTTSGDEEDAEIAREIAAQISVRLGLLRAMIDSYRDNANLAQELEDDPGEVKVVFARNTYDNIMCRKDFEDIESYGDDKYDLLLGLLDRLYAGDTNFNSEKQRPLASSAKLKGIYELKDYQIRLIYMREGEYTVVIGAVVKKDDNDKRYRSSLENMKKKSELYRRAVREGLLNMEEELERAQEFRVSISDGVRRGGR